MFFGYYKQKTTTQFYDSSWKKLKKSIEKRFLVCYNKGDGEKYPKYEVDSGIVCAIFRWNTQERYKSGYYNGKD